MAIQTFTQEEIGKNLKKIRKERKLNQKQLAALLDKSERTIQNYEAGEIDFSISTLKDIAIALDIDWRELLGERDGTKGIAVASRPDMNKYHIDTFGDIVSLLFKIQETYDITLNLEVAKPPEDREWKASLSVDGKGSGKFDADFCLFLENWMQKLELLYHNHLTIEKYQEWQKETVAYYSSGAITPWQERPDMEPCVLENGKHSYRWKNPYADRKDN